MGISPGKAARNLGIFQAGMRQTIARALREEAGPKILDHIRRRYFRRGGPPGRDYIVSRTGKLMGSLDLTVQLTSQGAVLRVKMYGPQAKILEYGGRTRAHTIRAKAGRVLHWVGADGQDRFARSVRHPGSRFIARRILTRGLNDKRAEIARTIKSTLREDWRRKVWAA